MLEFRAEADTFTQAQCICCRTETVKEDTKGIGGVRMAGNLVELTDGNFEETIGTGVTLVDFWAPWCAPCIPQGQICEQVAEKLGDKANVAKCNVDEGMQTAARYGIRAIPTLLLFKDGKVVQQFVGVRQESELLSAVEQAL